MKWNIDKRLLIYLSIGFVAATIIGTLSHELGHFFVAKSMGFDARINYAMTLLTDNSINNTMTEKNWFLFILGGPLETMLTGTIGLVLLFLLYESFAAVDRLSLKQWFLVFVSLFWLRETANLLMGLGGYFLSGQYSIRGDEARISRYLHFPIWTMDTATGIIGAIVLAIVVFRFIPSHQRFTFILSGLIGGISGYLLWLKSLGEIIMP